MTGWFRKLFRAKPEPVPSSAVPQETAEQLLEVLRRSARAQTKLTLRLDESVATLSGQITALRPSLDALSGHAAPAANAVPPPISWSGLLDAMDMLQHAIDSLAPTRADGVDQGLTLVLVRLDRFLTQNGISRLGARGETVDGKLFRVVGTVSDPSLPSGTIVRVVRAAATRDGEIVREGEVLTAGNP